MPAHERRQVIIQAARDVFMERGFSGGRTKEIAARAEVTEAFLYRHFSSKDEMYKVAILDPVAEGFERLAEELELLSAEQNDRRVFVYEMNRLCVAFFAEIAPLMTVALYSEVLNGRTFYRNELKASYDRIGKAVADGTGWASRDLNTSTIRQAMVGPHWAIGLGMSLRHPDANLDQVARRLSRLFVTGVNERPPNEMPAKSQTE
jgi:AcrR family transcriptional regulator